MNFEDLIGNEEVKRTLIKQVENNMILHSYLFIGQEGIGKRLFARKFAKMVLCLSNNKINCNKCDSCNKFIGGSHPDFFEIDSSGNSIKISQIREMEENVYQKPIISNKKVFIINDADKMTEEAQNSLLKTLEEPPEYIVIMLIASNENLLLNTIKSRCIKIPFQNIQKLELEKYAKDNKLIEDLTDNIVDLCNGSIGKVKKISENIDEYRNVEKLILNIINKKYNSIIDIINNSEIFYNSKDDIMDILDYIIVILYNEFKQNKRKIPINEVSLIIDVIEETKKRLQANANYDMSMDNMIFRIQGILQN